MLGRRVRRILASTTVFVAVVCVPAAPARADLGSPDAEAGTPTTTTTPAPSPAGAVDAQDTPAGHNAGGDAAGGSAGTSLSGGSARTTHPSPTRPD